MNLEKQIRQWQQAGVINAKQAEAMRKSEKQDSRNYLLYGVTLLSCFLIGLGIISLIASNWNAIPAAVKIGGGFVLLAANACGAYRAYDKSYFRLFDCLLFLFSILILGQIGLIIQVFQLQPSEDGLYNIAFLWTITLFPLIFFARSRLLPALWFPAMLTTLNLQLMKIDVVHDIVLFMGTKFSLMFLAFWYLIYQLSGWWNKTKSGSWRGGLNFWLIIIAVWEIYFYDFDVWDAYFYGFGISSHGLRFDATETVVYMYCLIVPVLIGGIAYSGYRNGGKFLSASIAALLYIASIYPFLCGAPVSLIALSLLAFAAYRDCRVRLLNFALVLIGIRVFVLYTEVLGSLAFQGAALILSGLLLLLMIFAVRKLSVYFSRRLVHAK